MNKNVMIGLGAVVLATLGFVIFGMSGADETKAGGQEGSEATAAATAGDSANVNADRKVKKDDEKAEEPKEEKKDLALPGQLPKLNLPAVAPTALPTKPHGKLKLEGDLQEVDAELAIRQVFPKIRSCYVELRQRAPQAKGRMLMRFRVSKSDDGQAATGELYLKETQFTDPKYLSCIRDAIDKTKFKLDKSAVNGTVTFPMHLAPEDVDKHNKAAAAK
ncbi:MAG: hypothetical protein KC502_10250 [Myxococcales bacterium]|nr:hypothetical protein [Myxococcales bacterium]